MTDLYPFKFNVETLEDDIVVNYLSSLPSYRYRISTIECVNGISIDEWRAIRVAAAQADADNSGDDHRVIDDEERKALLATDSDERVHIAIFGLPTTVSRKLLNRIAIQGGVNNAGITREAWTAAFRRGVQSYLVQFSTKEDAIAFKLAMWSRPKEGEE